MRKLLFFKLPLLTTVIVLIDPPIPHHKHIFI